MKLRKREKSRRRDDQFYRVHRCPSIRLYRGSIDTRRYRRRDIVNLQIRHFCQVHISSVEINDNVVTRLSRLKTSRFPVSLPFILQDNADYLSRERSVGRLLSRGGRLHVEGERKRERKSSSRKISRVNFPRKRSPPRSVILLRKYSYGSVLDPRTFGRTFIVPLRDRCSSLAGRQASVSPRTYIYVFVGARRAGVTRQRGWEGGLREGKGESFVGEKRRGRLEWADGATCPRRHPGRSWTLNADVRALHLRRILRVSGKDPAKFRLPWMVARRRSHL